MIFRVARRFAAVGFNYEQKTLQKLVDIKLVSQAAVSSLKLEKLEGLSNTTFKISEGTAQALRKPITFKWYKNTFSMFVSRDLEIEIITKLAERGEHPKILHSDKQCRVQEYAEGVGLASTKITSEHLLAIAEMLAHFSKTPISGRLNALDRRFDNLTRQAESIYRHIEAKHPLALQSSTKSLLSEVFGAELTSRIKKLVPKEMVLSHNDVNMTNCILSSSGKIILLDYEFACSNYLGYEIGNMLNEVATDYAGTFEIKPEWELSKASKQAIIDRYFSVLGLPVSREKQLHLVEVGRLLSHYFWMLVGLQSFEDADCQLDLNYYVTKRIEYIQKYLKQLHR